ncbi:MAG TPA: exodeoxyribonuclease III [Acidimicrobiales bacterium]|nr:exodeoxyribonuclease III [Acidimicrobiales bacterium]
MRIATWNVNSLKARMPRVEQWLGYAAPDVVCLQETKLADAGFPHLAFAAMGYESAHHGDGQWNGVAILSRVGIDAVVHGFAPGIEADTDTRLITARCGGVQVTSVYVPNGRSVDDPHYRYKLGWLSRLRSHLDALTDPSDLVAVCGDFNIAPDDRDVWDPARFVGSTHVTAEERAALADLEAWGLVDAFRDRYPDERLYSYWDYRAGDFHEHRGMRIDLLLLSSPLVGALRWALVDRSARKGKQPSDHAPVFVDVDIAADAAADGRVGAGVDPGVGA